MEKAPPASLRENAPRREFKGPPPDVKEFPAPKKATSDGLNLEPPRVTKVKAPPVVNALPKRPAGKPLEMKAPPPREEKAASQPAGGNVLPVKPAGKLLEKKAPPAVNPREKKAPPVVKPLEKAPPSQEKTGEEYSSKCKYSAEKE